MNNSFSLQFTTEPARGRGKPSPARFPRRSYRSFWHTL
jgi:hypothetical protein